MNSRSTVSFGEQHVLNVTLEKIPPKIDEDKDFIEGTAFFKEAKYAEAVGELRKSDGAIPGDRGRAFQPRASAPSGPAGRTWGSPPLRPPSGSMPDMIEAYFVLGEEYFAMGDRDKSQAAFDRAIALDPANPKAHYNLGIIFYKSGMLDEALASFAEGHRARPGFLFGPLPVRPGQRGQGRVRGGRRLLHEIPRGRAQRAGSRPGEGHDRRAQETDQGLAFEGPKGHRSGGDT